MYNVIIESKNFFTTCYMFKFISFCFNNQHLFACEQKENLVKCIMESAAAFVGIAVKQRKEPIAFENFITHRLGKYRSELRFDPLSNIFLDKKQIYSYSYKLFVGIFFLICYLCVDFSTDEALTSYAEFTVQKISPRHSDPVRRTMCLTETCLVERDPATYNVVTSKPLCDVSSLYLTLVISPQDFKVEYSVFNKFSDIFQIFAIIRDQENPQKFSVEYVKGAIRTYLSTDR